MDEYDRSFELPKELSNSLEIQDGVGRKVVYTAQAWGIYFDGVDSVRGGATIQKLIMTPRPNHTRLSLRPLRLESVPTSPAEKIVWTFRTDSGYDFFISHGNITGFDCSANPKSDLAGVAVSEGVLISKTLLQDVFAPIDRELLRLQKLVASNPSDWKV